jgi:hypothetical protein
VGLHWDEMKSGGDAEDDTESDAAVTERNSGSRRNGRGVRRKGGRKRESRREGRRKRKKWST